jgi:hypothetical protein
MKFNVNSTFLYGVAAVVILFVLAQSVFFLVRAFKRGKELGISTAKLKKTIISTAVFTIAPALSILIGIITLSKFLGIPLPWIRMSVIGAITYELPAATSTANALGVSLSETITDPATYTAIAWVMTLGILPSLIFPPILMKKIQGGMGKMKAKDQKWGDIFMTSLFLGMISAFLGYVFCDVSNVVKGDMTGIIPVLVMLVSAVIMMVAGSLATRFKIRWLTDYALPLSLMGGMASAIPITMWLA